jgi:hypothetical protein
MTKIALAAMRLENLPVAELSIPSDARMAPCGYRATFHLVSPEWAQNAALTFELQLQTQPAIQVKELPTYLLGYLEGLLRDSLAEDGPHRTGFEQGLAAAKSIS